MSDKILVTGNTVEFDNQFGDATFIGKPVVPPLIGTSLCFLNQRPVCVEGDEKLVIGIATYKSSAFTAPGLGVITIVTLTPGHKSKVKIRNRAALLKGGSFTAKFQVTQPAIDPASGSPDPVPVYMGKGSFITTNTQFTTNN